MIHESLGESALEVAERLSLSACAEGGWRRPATEQGSPIACTLRLLDAASALGWRRRDAHAAWCWHAGTAAVFEVFDPGAAVAKHRLGVGANTDAPAAPVSIVPPYAWHRVAPTEGWCLLSEIVSPGAKAADAEVAPRSWAPGAPDPRFSPLLSRAISELRAESGSIHLLLDDGLLHLICAQAIPDPVLSLVRRVPVGKGMAGHAVERRGPVTACNIQTDQSGDVRPGARATGMEGAIVVPIFDERDGAVGALGVANRAARTFTPEETVRLIDLGRDVAKARLGRDAARR